MNLVSLSTLSLVLAPLCASALSMPSSAQAQNPDFPFKELVHLRQEEFEGVIPDDIAITPNAQVAFVRCDLAADGAGHGCDGDLILAFDLTHTDPLTSARIPFTPFQAEPQCTEWSDRQLSIADSVRVTDKRAVLIGSSHDTGTVEDRIRVDILAITPATATTPPNVSSLISFVYWVARGDANDVAITPDGSKAVVASSRFVRVFDLAVGQPPGTLPSLLREVTIPSLFEDKSPRWWVTMPGNDFSDVAASSLLVTDDRAIVQYGARDSCGWAQSFVYIVNLVGPNGTPELSVQTDTTACVGGAPENQKSPHDLAMSPNGKCVTGGLNSLALFDVSAVSGPTLLQTLNNADGRAGGTYLAYRYSGVDQLGPVVDSVVMSNDRVIAIRDNDNNSGIRVYRVDYSGATPVLVRLSPGRGLFPYAQVHDVAMSPNGERAIVSTVAKNTLGDTVGTSHIFTNLSSTSAVFLAGIVTPTSGPAFHPNATPRGSTLDLLQYYPKIFVSDSVLATNTYAVAISTDDLAVGPFQGYVDVFNITTGAVVYSKTLSLTQPWDRLADLTLSPGGGYLFVRGTDSSTPVSSGKDFVGYVLSSGAEMGTFGLPGDCVGVDVVEATPSRVVTSSWDPTTGKGYFDIFKY